jgi:hypothetical protein
MVIIHKSLREDGTLYEIEDFPAYVEELRRRNIDTPLVQYGVFIPFETEQAIRAACADLERQIALFFRLGPSSGIDYQVVGP